MVYCIVDIDSRNVNMSKVILNVVNSGFFMCVYCRLLLCLLEHPLSLEKGNHFNKVLPFFLTDRSKGVSFGFLIVIDTFRMYCILWKIFFPCDIQDSETMWWIENLIENRLYILPKGIHFSLKIKLFKYIFKVRHLCLVGKPLSHVTSLSRVAMLVCSLHLYF